ncbi:MAG: dihydrofolate reductase family protein [Bradymonadia bacterium]
MTTGRLRVYIACSLDGFIAGTDSDLSWLPGADGGTADADSGDAITYGQFMGDVGAMLMGRQTYDVVSGFGGPWPYGDTPVLVATHRALEDAPDSVQAVSGDFSDLVAQALTRAGGKDVYLDGGALVRQALELDLVDQAIVTVVPVILGEGVPLFAGLRQRKAMQFDAVHRYGEMVQWVLSRATTV